MGWGIKPRVARLDLSNPLVEGLCFCVYPGGQHQHELVAGGLGTATGGQSKWFTRVAWNSPHGQDYVLQCNGATHKGHWPFPGILSTITTDCSMFVILSPEGLQNFSHILMVPYRNNGTWLTPFASMGLQRTGVTSAMEYIYAQNSTTLITTVSDTGPFTLTASVPHLFGCTRQGATLKFYKDGLQTGATKTIATNAAVDWGSHAPVTICNRASDSDGERLEANTAFAGIWNRPLSADEVFRLWMEPWTLLQAEQFMERL